MQTTTKIKNKKQYHIQSIKIVKTLPVFRGGTLKRNRPNTFKSK